MKINIGLSFFIAVLLSVIHAEAQKTVKAKGDYIQIATNTTFPTNIDNYARTAITSFDKNKTDLGVTYENPGTAGKTTLTVYIYPAGRANEDRLRNEYSNSLRSIAIVTNKGIHASQVYSYFKKNGYKINGYKAYIINENKTSTVLEIYECGSWFFKIRTSSGSLDSVSINKLNKKVLELFSPDHLVKISSLSASANVNVGKEAFRDSVLLGCAISSTLKEIGWAEKNIDSLERAAGFPGLYLDIHIEALKDFANFANEKKGWTMSPTTKAYLYDLNLLINSGFLSEFIMEQYDMIMIVPENRKFDFESFHKWKESHPTTIDLNVKFASAVYEAKNK